MQNLLDDEKVICYEENGTIPRLNFSVIWDVLKNVKLSTKDSVAILWGP